MDSANNRLTKVFARALGDVSVEITGLDHETGATRLAIHGSAGNWRLLALWAGEGWPADVRSAFDGLPPGRPAAELVLVARRFSPGAIELLAQRGANWADESGSAQIDGPGLFIVRRMGDKRDRARSEFSWSPSAVATAEALLAKDWTAGVGTTELATLAHRSPAQVSQVLQVFDEKGWTIKYGPQRGPKARRELIDPESLLSDWSTFVSEQERETRLAHRTFRSPLDFLEGELSQALNRDVRWALSGWAAAHELAPISATVPSLQIYVHEDDFGQPLNHAIKDAGLSDVAEGGRVAFFPATDSIFALVQQRAVGPIVSGPRIYADLKAFGGRGADAAVHLKEEALDRLYHPPRGRREAPHGLVAWERKCRERLDELARDRPDLSDAYAQGTWSASYRLVGVPEAPSLRLFMAILREVAGEETGWPPWWVPDSDDIRPQPVDGTIECWHSDTRVFDDSAHADYWRGDPRGRLCLIRGYQEDSQRERLVAEPRTGFDLTLPIWRTGECLLHAERLAHRLDARSIQFMMRWTGVRGRKLASLAGDRSLMQPTRPAAQDDLASFAEVAPGEIAADLSGVVRQLVDPLYEIFDFYEPPARLYEDELAAMRRTRERR